MKDLKSCSFFKKLYFRPHHSGQCKSFNLVFNKENLYSFCVTACYEVTSQLSMNFKCSRYTKTEKRVERWHDMQRSSDGNKTWFIWYVLIIVILLSFISPTAVSFLGFCLFFNPFYIAFTFNLIVIFKSSLILQLLSFFSMLPITCLIESYLQQGVD